MRETDIVIVGAGAVACAQVWDVARAVSAVPA